MPSTYTTRNRLEKQGVGENSNTWGTLLNVLIDLVDAMGDGMVSFTGNKTLTTANGTSDEARCRYLNITGGTTATVTVPNVEKLYIIRNAGSGAATITTGSGTTATVAAGANGIVVCEGGNVCRNLLPTTGSGNFALSASPTFTGTLVAATLSFNTFSTVQDQSAIPSIGRFSAGDPYSYLDWGTGAASSGFRFRPNGGAVVVEFNANGIDVTGRSTCTTWSKVGSYTVAGVPSAATAGAGAIIYVSNESGGAQLAFSDATNWRRVVDRAIIS